MLEARCTKCGETFNPHDETDLEHLQTEMEEPCGGAGVIVGEWHPITMFRDLGGDHG